MTKPSTPEQLRLAANVIRGLAMDAIQKANSGHPGMPMGMADVAACLWLDHLRFRPEEPRWPGRDRFVLSAGHGSMLLYSLLHLSGFDLSLDDIRNFRQLHSKTPGHPEVGVTAGVETTTGPLGQGFANGVGMALAARMEAARFGCPLADQHRVFAIVSDGDLMEGVSAEAASLAGHLKLSNLIYFYDDNRITIDGDTSLTFTEDVGKRFEAYGWRVLELDDAHDPRQVRTALDAATDHDERPTLVRCRSHIGFGSPGKQDKSSSHGSPLGVDELAATKRALDLPEDPFWVPDEVRGLFATAADRGRATADEWSRSYAAWAKAEPENASTHRAFAERRVPDDLLEQLLEVIGDGPAATRALSGKVIQKAATLVPSLVGGSADLDASCKTAIKDSTSVRPGEYAGRNLHFGIREHAMGSILNGMALHDGYLPMGSTFLVFADYMRPAIRLAALMGLPVTYVFTHDSVMVGEDGPTHQPIEHAVSLRIIPHLHVFRPADGVEVAAAWTHSLTRGLGPTALLLTRQNLPQLTRPESFEPADAMRGGYTLRDTDEPRAIIVASGSEVSLAVAAAEKLAVEGIDLRVASLPCIKLFLDQERAWREAVLPPGVPVIAIELGRPEHWCTLTGSLDRVIGVERFGESAPAQVLAEEFGFTPDAIAEQLRAMIQ